MTAAIHIRRPEGHSGPMEIEHEQGCEHAIEYGNGRTSHCRCGKDIPSDAASVEAHMYPLTTAEQSRLGLAPMLRVYPKEFVDVDNGEELAYIGPGWQMFVEDADERAKAKRFTDAELAAEMFSAIALSAEMDVHGILAGPGIGGDAFSERSASETDRALALERFATLPHYDEQP